MNKNDLLKKQQLAEELGIKFAEAAELFSEETLNSMRMEGVNGGVKVNAILCGSGANGSCPNSELNAILCGVEINVFNCNEEPTPSPTPRPIPEITDGAECIFSTPTVAQDAICGIGPTPPPTLPPTTSTI